jgi:hypothetical protein
MLPHDIATRLRTAILTELQLNHPNCHTKLTQNNCTDQCTPQYGFCNTNDLYPTNPCGCTALQLIAQNVTQKPANRCWVRESQKFTVQVLLPWPVVPCDFGEVEEALVSLSECRCAVLSVLRGLGWVELGLGARMGGAGSGCGPVALGAVVECVRPQGGCAGWQFVLEVGV